MINSVTSLFSISALLYRPYVSVNVEYPSCGTDQDHRLTVQFSQMIIRSYHVIKVKRMKLVGKV